ncbi:hypothetical protein ACSQ67_016544 [Phaseolus vulgaris]
MIYDVNSPLFRSFLSQKGGSSDKRKTEEQKPKEHRPKAKTPEFVVNGLILDMKWTKVINEVHVEKGSTQSSSLAVKVTLETCKIFKDGSKRDGGSF